MRPMSSQQENVTNAFKGILKVRMENKFAIHNTRPLFGNIEGGSVKNLCWKMRDWPTWEDRVAPIANVIKETMQLSSR